MLSGKSTYGSRETELLQRRKTNVSRVEDVLTNYSLCDERRNHWHDSSCNGNFINPGRDCVRSRTLRQSRLARFSIIPKHVVVGKQTQGVSVAKPFEFVYPILYLKILANKHTFGGKFADQANRLNSMTMHLSKYCPSNHCIGGASLKGAVLFIMAAMMDSSVFQKYFSWNVLDLFSLTFRTRPIELLSSGKITRMQF